MLKKSLNLSDACVAAVKGADEEEEGVRVGPFAATAVVAAASSSITFLVLATSCEPAAPSSADCQRARRASSMLSPPTCLAAFVVRRTA